MYGFSQNYPRLRFYSKPGLHCFDNLMMVFAMAVVVLCSSKVLSNHLWLTLSYGLATSTHVQF